MIFEINISRKDITFSKEFPRPSIKFIRNRDKEELIVAEVGTYKGLNARSILKTIPIKKLYLIDLYEGEYSSSEEVAKERLVKYEDKITWIKKDSIKAVEDIKEQLDFVYIDGNHSYQGIKGDLITYYEKLKDGGVIGGHDIDLGGKAILKDKEIKDKEGVAEAVIEFVAEKGIELYIYKSDWWFVKGAESSSNKKVQE